ncbi:MAG TPA: polysaccharide biosynthesis C-terminal domain-containing protein [Chitinophagaceae bacterium]|nr:polysaccharide biosynthesis C-terminal domain-containing protein [Chitinophagaceae bacterium]
MSIKKLAGQTLWYGVPKILSRFLNYGLTLMGFWLFDATETSNLTQVYAIIPFLNVLFTYGLETSYFRFAQNTDRNKLYNTLTFSVIITTIFFTIVLLLAQEPLARFFELRDNPEYVTWMIGILFFDTLAVIPLAKLRLEERPRKYAFVNVASIVINIFLVIFFLFIARNKAEQNPASVWIMIYQPDVGVGYFIIANLIASALSLLFLYKEFSAFKWLFDKKLWLQVLNYSYPLIIVGFGGMINEMLSRLVYRKVLHLDAMTEKRELGIFGANYKLAVLITIFIQVFRLGAEPFFFNQSTRGDAPRTYARVMKFFVIACCFMFLVVVLFLDFWKLLIAARFQEYAEGIHIVPILAMGSVFLGIYYNLSVWYKLTNKTMYGAYITIAGAVLTILLNIWWIPSFHYTGAAWATFFCYAFMMVVSYLQGQHYYPVPYAWKKLVAYLVIVSLIYMIQLGIATLTPEWTIFHFGTGMVLLGAFTLFVLKIEKKELERLPYVGRFVTRLI